MSDLAIAVENLSKCFNISHESPRSRRYRTLRDDLIELPRRLLTRLAKNGEVTSEIFWALKNISFEVRQGEVIGIIGRNGAGKSTLLKILTRITEPTSGFADIYGRVGALLEVGTGFNPEFTGRENIFLNGAILGMSRAEIRKKFDEIVAFAEIEQFLDTPVKRYSSGMYLRLAFAVAAHLDPEILLVDEVLAVGDAEFQKKCLGKMDEVATKQGRTVLFVSHNLDAVYHLCSRCILLRSGEIEMSGNTADVVATYLGSREQEDALVEFRPTNKDATFTSAALSAPDSEPATSFHPNTPILMKCSFDVRRSIMGLQVSFSVFNFKGEHVFYSTISMAKPAISVDAPGTHDICAIIPARLLLPGRYFISLWLHVPNAQMYDARAQALCFQVVGSAEGYHGFPTDELGQVYADVKWQKNEEPSTRARAALSASR